MLIILLHVNRSPYDMMKYAGYVFRPLEKDFIREDSQGRWHAKLIDLATKTLDIHYDLNVEWRHVVFNLPIKSNAERKRILNIARKFERYRFTPSMWHRTVASLRDKGLLNSSI